MPIAPFQTNVKRLVNALSTYFYRRGGGAQGLYAYHPLTAYLQSTSLWATGFSDVNWTTLDTSSDLGVPAGIKAAYIGVSIRDSGSAANDCYVTFSVTGATSLVTVDCSGLANNKFERNTVIVPCDSNGDFKYKIEASGSGTFDIWLSCLGWWL